MELQHINVKLYLQDPETVKLEDLVPVFHEWIQNRFCQELLIDVADYRHVYAGSGVVLVGYEADYSIDDADNRLGIRYNRKAALAGSNRERLSQALEAALLACRRLESNERLGETLRFDRRNIGLFVNDRMLALNVTAQADSVRAELKEFFTSAFGDGDFDMRFESDPRRRLGVEVRTGKPLELDSVLERLSH